MQVVAFESRKRHAMLECAMTSSLTLALRQFSTGLVLGIVVFCQNASHAQEAVDIVEYFARAQDARGSGLARKSQPVDVRSAKPGEVIFTMIKGEGKETQSPPAKSGDMVVRNRCPETGNEQFLVPAPSFSERYEGPLGATDTDGWSPYRPRGIQVRFVVVTEQDGSLNFIAPWGERMVARPGDLIVQDVKNSKDTYRVAKAAFACTYEVLRELQR
jgi:hypothetical protein